MALIPAPAHEFLAAASAGRSARGLGDTETEDMQQMIQQARSGEAFLVYHPLAAIVCARPK